MRKNVCGQGYQVCALVYDLVYDQAYTTRTNFSSAPSPCTGAIPPDLGNCTALVTLRLDDNQLTGAQNVDSFWLV